MTGRILAIALATLLASGNAGHAYDDAAARAEERGDLFAALASAPDSRIADAAVAAIWAHWQTAPNAEAQALLDTARLLLTQGMLDRSIAALDALVTQAPDYSEGWNTRATVLFMKRDFDGSLNDIERTLALEPKHFGALAGRAMILLEQGDRAGAVAALEAATAIQPFLREGALLRD